MAEEITVNGNKLFVETMGSGPAILMMHGGLGLSHDYFRPYFDASPTAIPLFSMTIWATGAPTNLMTTPR